jgi:hypothetical protein
VCCAAGVFTKLNLILCAHFVPTHASELFVHSLLTAHALCVLCVMWVRLEEKCVQRLGVACLKQTASEREFAVMAFSMQRESATILI